MFNFKRSMGNKYGDEVSNLIKSLIKITQKLERCKASIEFIKTSLNHGEPPDFTRINLANDQLKNDQRFIRFIRWQVTERELEYKYKYKAQLDKDYRHVHDNVSSKLTTEDWCALHVHLEDLVAILSTELKSKHLNKLGKLGITPRIVIDETNITTRNNDKTNFEFKDAIFNFSNYELSQIETQLLSKGLKFGIYEKKVDTFEILSRFELFAQSFDKLNIVEKHDERKSNLDSKNTFLKALQVFAFDFIELSEKAKDNLSFEEREALNKLSKNDQIVISKADKGNAVVIQNISDYKKKINDLLNTSGKFKKLEHDPTVEREKYLYNHLKYIWDTRGLDKTILDRIQPCGSRAGVMYGLPKVHKNGLPIRPIISAVKTYNYNLAKYLDEILKPLIKDNNMMLIDTYDFINKVSKMKLDRDKFLLSFDVESLFTNIPTDETIKIILDLAYKNGEATHFHGLKMKDLKHLLEICTKNSHFQFNGIFYDQIDGVAMGSPLGPLFANVFMSNFERLHRKRLEELGVKIWLRYVDDVFASIEEENKATEILKFLNQQHPNIKFTIECEQEGKLPFLDTLVYRGQTTYHTTIFRKKTFTGVYLNWTSLTSKKYKIGLIYCFMDRIWRICSENHLRDEEVRKLRYILAKNDYPEHVVNREIEKFISSRTLSTNSSVINNSEQQPRVNAQPKPTRFLVLPYVSRKAEGFAKKVQHLVNEYYPQVDFNIAFKTPDEIGKHFPYKDNIKAKDGRSLVIYRIKCKHEGCEASYIGKTERILQHRINEHRKFASSACHQHEKENIGHEMDYDNVEIIDSADSNMKLLCKELLHIVQKKPLLNRQLGAHSKYNIKTLIIAAYPQFTDEASTS